MFSGFDEIKRLQCREKIRNSKHEIRRKLQIRNPKRFGKATFWISDLELSSLHCTALHCTASVLFLRILRAFIMSPIGIACEYLRCESPGTTGVRGGRR